MGQSGGETFLFHFFVLFVTKLQIYTRDTRLPILPHVMASLAMGLNWGNLRVFADHTRKSKRKTNALTIFACRTAFNV